MLTQQKQWNQEPAQKATCAKCPYFTPNQGVHGWCKVFDRMAKPLHQRTSICELEIEALEKHKHVQQQPLKPQWSITWNSQWQWYAVWVGKSYAGSATKYEEAERLAQKYVASHNSWQQHRERVLAAYAD